MVFHLCTDNILNLQKSGVCKVYELFILEPLCSSSADSFPDCTLEHSPWATTALLPSSQPSFLPGTHITHSKQKHTLQDCSHPCMRNGIVDHPSCLLWPFLLSTLASSHSSSSSFSCCSQLLCSLLCSPPWLHCCWGWWGVICRRWGILLSSYTIIIVPTL